MFIFHLFNQYSNSRHLEPGEGACSRFFTRVETKQPTRLCWRLMSPVKNARS